MAASYSSSGFSILDHWECCMISIQREYLDSSVPFSRRLKVPLKYDSQLRNSDKRGHLFRRLEATENTNIYPVRRQRGHPPILVQIPGIVHNAAVQRSPARHSPAGLVLPAQGNPLNPNTQLRHTAGFLIPAANTWGIRGEGKARATGETRREEIGSARTRRKGNFDRRARLVEGQDSWGRHVWWERTSWYEGMGRVQEGSGSRRPSLALTRCSGTGFASLSAL
eukprot:6212793-Pleurochrysis_carterae.AAC.3